MCWIFCWDKDKQVVISSGIALICNPKKLHTMADQQWQKMANLVFEIDKKVLAKETNTSLQRIQDKMKRVLEEAGVFIYDPTGEKYNETRTDVEANISGSSTSGLVITDVIKPILYTETEGRKQLIQQGVVIVSGN